MWQAISKRLSEELMFDFQILDRSRIEGGDISECYMISDGEERYFVKINNKEFLNKFEAEADNLKKLRATNTLYVPEVVLVDNCKSNSFLILNYIATKPLCNDKSSFQLGVDLANLHLFGEQQEYGFDQDNFLGATLQPNRWRKKWSRFFSEQRIGWQLKLLEEKGISFGAIEDIVENINQQLLHHHPSPSLLHGDLWHGNAGNTAFGPLCYDPASYWGDKECDIAMTELFDGFQPEFYKGYESVITLDKGYQNRKKLYNLYHILNHCNLFGGHYLDEADQYFSEIF
ncbi:hypothetical protein MACH09_13910 [Vibrio sp. MACH09]|uniref:fructosamine kinase family protein n=1 Tax=unclassified Vibrio TaxID=2614977 RepID=UPI001493750F|nr:MULTISPECIES: fructosamine kinase family protein [unclassified Vibrio]NOI68732.1 fructosamine kinase family protein [Vibrio sp. 99-8-1]GLO60883.1 hypothetical protein MACH09_13910 [Vibrio sp. MACH09]